MLKKRSYWKLLIAIFILSISTPFIEMFFRFDKTPPRSENRNLTNLPKISDFKSINHFLSSWRSYVDDNFGFRNFFISTYGWIRFRLLGSSPSADVMLGKEGWLFLAKQSNVALSRGVFPFTDAEVVALANSISERAAWAASRKISYIYTVGPDSHTLNPEYLPSWAVRREGPTRLDQLMSEARKRQLPVLDLRPTLMAAKQGHPISFKTDTHWNKYGAYISYKELLGRLNRIDTRVGLPVVGFNDLEFRTTKGPGMDLALLAGLQNSIFEESEDAEYVGRVEYRTFDRQGLHFSTFNPAGRPLSVVCICDSMAGNLFPYLARQFRSVRVMWGYPFEVNEITKQKPDIIIQMVIERTLAWPLVENPPEVQSFSKK